jgi:hypothetical protein
MTPRAGIATQRGSSFSRDICCPARIADAKTSNACADRVG